MQQQFYYEYHTFITVAACVDSKKKQNMKLLWKQKIITKIFQCCTNANTHTHTIFDDGTRRNNEKVFLIILYTIILRTKNKELHEGRKFNL